MRAERAKQVFKNAVYRTVGETANVTLTARAEQRTLVVLMYHKVNSTPRNPVTVAPDRFAEQMACLADTGYHVVDLDDVLAHYHEARPLPPRAVLITFDDGYRDNLDHALPVLERHGYPAVIFVPLDFVGDVSPLPHEERLLTLGIRNSTLGWDGLEELERRGVRVESHGISHRRLAGLAPAEAEHEIAASKRQLEERLGRPVRAFAYVKGSKADFEPVHVSMVRRSGYQLGFTTVSGGNSATTDPFLLRRYNVEPYPLRTFELVLRGACDLVSLKDTVAGARARRVFNAAFGTSSR